MHTRKKVCNNRQNAPMPPAKVYSQYFVFYSQQGRFNSIRDLFLALLTFNSLFEACTSYSRLSIDSCKLRQAHMQPHISTLSCNLVRSSARGDPCTAYCNRTSKGRTNAQMSYKQQASKRANGQTNKRANEQKKERMG